MISLLAIEVQHLQVQLQACTFGPVHNYGPYYLNGIVIDSVGSQRDLGILFDN